MKHFRDVRITIDQSVFSIHLGSGAGEETAVYLAVPCLYGNALEELCIGLQLDGQLGFCLDLLGLVPHIGEDQRCSLVNCQGEVAVDVGLRTIGWHTLLTDRCSYDRFACLIEDRTLYGQLLSKSATDR